MKKPIIIAEVKTESPFGFKSDKSWDELFEVASKGGDIISIHTDPRWSGSFDLIKKAKTVTDKPILAKGIHETDDQIQKAIDCGADFVLVVGRIKEIHKDKRLIDPNSLDELKNILEDLKAVWNSLDLGTVGFKKETFKEAREIFGGWICQASNIKTKDEVLDGADAVLVGTNLVGFIESL